MNEKVLLKSEQKMSSQEIADFLVSLSEKIRSGKVTLKQGDVELSYNLPDSLVLELKVEEEEKRNGLKRSIEVEVEWIEGEGGEDKVILG